MGSVVGFGSRVQRHLVRTSLPAIDVQQRARRRLPGDVASRLEWFMVGEVLWGVVCVGGVEFFRKAQFGALLDCGEVELVGAELVEVEGFEAVEVLGE